MRHPEGMGEAEIQSFLTALAVQRNVSAATQNQALAALLFLYRDVLKRPLDGIDPEVRAKRPERLPLVLTRQEVAIVLSNVTGTSGLVGRLRIRFETARSFTAANEGSRFRSRRDPGS